MANVHLLRQVRRGVINDDVLRVLDLRHAQTWIGQNLLDLAGQPVGIKKKVNKSGPGNLDLTNQFRCRKLLNQLCRQLPRILLRQLSHNHRQVGGQVAMRFIFGPINLKARFDVSG